MTKFFSAVSETAYSTFGYFNSARQRSLLGFNGQARDSATNADLLGNGRRAYSSVLMRFISPDDQSPFGLGGINTYAYCGGDPINHTDPTGHVKHWIVRGRIQQSERIASNDLIARRRAALSLPADSSPIQPSNREPQLNFAETRYQKEFSDADRVFARKIQASTSDAIPRGKRIVEATSPDFVEAIASRWRFHRDGKSPKSLRQIAEASPNRMGVDIKSYAASLRSGADRMIALYQAKQNQS
ncbi:RHS repeat-associated core domain-containing protein [Pseudomonas putida]|uniref:RHS repeat-associated core domain-containing protein n=1 Tax=Pseudomonas putida TaxID=303 RepID=A0A4D6X9M4_PSEPU|nr:RHS repeat-associated core domain-containing protein [Pseudomonas putida]QCI12627.1 RHS repeat-associated core domain-containing protein [Pseudomonas putida]